MGCEFYSSCVWQNGTKPERTRRIAMKRLEDFDKFWHHFQRSTKTSLPCSFWTQRSKGHKTLAGWIKMLMRPCFACNETSSRACQTWSCAEVNFVVCHCCPDRATREVPSWRPPDTLPQNASKISKFRFFSSICVRSRASRARASRARRAGLSQSVSQLLQLSQLSLRQDDFYKTSEALQFS